MGGEGFIYVIEYMTLYKMFQHQFMCRYLGYAKARHMCSYIKTICKYIYYFTNPKRHGTIRPPGNFAEMFAV